MTMIDIDRAATFVLFVKMLQLIQQSFAQLYIVMRYESNGYSAGNDSREAAAATVCGS